MGFDDCNDYWDEQALRVPWEQRRSVGFFRGSMTCPKYAECHRCPRALAAVENWRHNDSGLLDVGIIDGSNFCWPYVQAATKNEWHFVQPSSMADHVNYKHLIHMDGHS
jgi:hypothetical protein